MSTSIFPSVKSDRFDLLSDVFCQIIMLLLDSVLFGRFKIGKEALDVSDVDANFV